jgi:TolB-like protein
VAGHLLEDRTREASESERVSLPQPISQAATAPMRRSGTPPAEPEGERRTARGAARPLKLFTEPGSRGRGPGSLIALLLITAAAVASFLYFQPLAGPGTDPEDPDLSYNPTGWTELREPIPQPQQHEDEDVVEISRVLVLPFALVRTGSSAMIPDEQVFGLDTYERVEAQLLDVSELEVVPLRVVAAQLEQHRFKAGFAEWNDQVERLAGKLDADFVVTGSVQPISASRVVLTTKVFSALTERPVCTLGSPRFTRQELRQVYDEIARKVRSCLPGAPAPEDGGAATD